MLCISQIGKSRIDQKKHRRAHSSDTHNIKPLHLSCKSKSEDSAQIAFLLADPLLTPHSMMGNFGNDSSIEGDVYVQRLATYIRKNEEGLANGLLCFSKVRAVSNVKPLRPSFTIHHLYYITERIESSSLGVDVGPLNVKLDTPNHEPTFISFMANNARTLRVFESDARSITSINSVKSIVSSASVYWRSFAFSKDPKIIQKDVKYLYSSFTKIPCLILNPKTKINTIAGYEEYPCDTSVPLKMFKNLQVLELVEYEPNEVFGWHTLSEQLRILIIRNSKVSDIAEVLFNLVLDDETGRSSFSDTRLKKHDFDHSEGISAFKHPRRERALTSGNMSRENGLMVRDNDLKWAHTFHSTPDRDTTTLPDNKWFFLKQLTVTESSISSIPAFVFKPLSNVVKLNLSNNLLEDLPEGLDQLHNVKYMNFADNYITSLARLPLNLVHLTTLNFNNNKISSIDGIQRLSAIEKIDLRRNKLKDIKLLKPILWQVLAADSKLTNIYISSNPLPKTYRADLFNLFNGAKPKNTIKLDDSRPGYFESAMLLDADGAMKVYAKFLGIHVPLEDTTMQQENPLLPKSLVPTTPERQILRHRQAKSTNDVLESIALLNIQDIEATIANRKCASIMTTASTTASTTPTVSTPATAEHINLLPSPSLTFAKSNMPLLPNQNLNNQPQLCTNKIPSITRQSFQSPMMHLSINGSATTLKSSGTMARIDLESTLVHNPAPSVITPVQVQVEGFQ